MTLAKNQSELSDNFRDYAMRVVGTTSRIAPEELLMPQTVAALVDAFSVVDRSQFLDEALFSRAFEDISLPIGFGEASTKPSVAALMLLGLGLSANDRVLEVGAGSGYLTALLAKLSASVFSLERLPGLARVARQRLDAMRLTNILLRSGNGNRGWRDMAPFTAILVTTAFENIPEPLLLQLADGGRLVAPVFIRGAAQKLVRFEKLPTEKAGELRFRTLELASCRFAPALK